MSNKELSHPKKGLRNIAIYRYSSYHWMKVVAGLGDVLLVPDILGIPGGMRAAIRELRYIKDVN